MAAAFGASRRGRPAELAALSDTVDALFAMLGVMAGQLEQAARLLGDHADRIAALERAAADKPKG
jgi:hypothetical protein